MPIITKTIKHKFKNSEHMRNVMQKYNLQYPCNQEVELPLINFKLLSPRDIYHPIECECDICHKKFTKTVLHTTIENIENNTIMCKECNRKKTNQKKFGRDYPFYDPNEKRF